MCPPYALWGLQIYFILLGTPRNASLCQIVRAHFQCDLIARKDADEIHAQLAGDVSQDHMPARNLYLERRVRQSFLTIPSTSITSCFDILVSPILTFKCYVVCALYAVSAVRICRLVERLSSLSTVAVGAKCISFFFFGASILRRLPSAM